MVNRPRKKGTEFEVSVLQKILRPIWPKAVRSGTTLGSGDRGDFFGTENWLIEAKNCKRWSLPEWIRVLRKKAGTHPWGILANQDGRRIPMVMVQPADQWRDFMIEYNTMKLALAAYRDRVE